MSQGLYRELILEHSRDPRNAGRLEHPTHRARAANPLCGDELEVTLRLADGRVAEVRFAVRGCVISQAAASLSSLVVQGATAVELTPWAQAFRAGLEGPEALLPETLAALAPLLELRHHRSRIGCALLAWTALERALEGGAAE